MVNEARAPTDEKLRVQILSEYKNGIGPKALAEKTGISINTIKSWIKRDKAKKHPGGKDASKKDKGAPQKRKKGAPLGNKNAVGHGAPTGNQNALKHGAYSGVYWDFLREDEQELIVSDDEEQLLIEQIQLFSIRERRIMQAINKYTAEKSGQYISGAIKIEDKRVFEEESDKVLYKETLNRKVQKGDRLPGEKYNLSTNTNATIDLITRLERELTAIQSKKTKAIAELAKLRAIKNEETSGSKELVDDWITGVIGGAPDE